MYVCVYEKSWMYFGEVGGGGGGGGESRDSMYVCMYVCMFMKEG